MFCNHSKNKGAEVLDHALSFVPFTDWLRKLRHHRNSFDLRHVTVVWLKKSNARVVVGVVLLLVFLTNVFTEKSTEVKKHNGQMHHFKMYLFLNVRDFKCHVASLEGEIHSLFGGVPRFEI